MDRRRFLHIASRSAALLAARPMLRALAVAPARAGDDYFLFIHAAGGWDVTLWADPRNERKGLVEPASTANSDTAAIRLWKDAPLDGDTRSFQIVEPPGSALRFGPAIGNLVDHAARLCVVNGLAMNTVSHPDGVAFSATGRHLQGARVPASSVNTVVAAELGIGQVFPSVSVQFPSSFAGDELDRRAAPLTVERIGNLGRTLARPTLYEDARDRAAVTALLTDEANALARRANYPGALGGMALQYASLQRMLDGDLAELLSDEKLRAAWPGFNYKARFQGQGAVNAAFAVEAMRRNLVRCVSFSLGGFDTHGNNYRGHGQVQQETFDSIAALLVALDGTSHPTRAGRKLADHTHLLVFSDFCRTPQVNLAGGRDHYPNNSALVISPRFRGGLRFGATDGDQLLPARAKRFSDGDRAIAPPDLLCTFLAAVGIEPRRHLRDGEVVPELLAS